MKINDYRYIQFGCGHSATTKWRNFDASPTLRFERLPLIGRLYSKNTSRFPLNVEYGDIVKGLPVPKGSFYGVYCSHVLEHLSLEDFRIALRNIRDLLRTGGVFRFVMPDLEHLARKYISDKSVDASSRFMRESSLGLEKRSHNLKGFIVQWLGNSQHQWMWDYKSVESELRCAGFIEVRRAIYGDSSDPKFNEVEDRERWDNCLGVECRK